jgi:bile acid:Na+ symporter, BASS family
MKLKQSGFTFIILLAVTIAMIFPQWFTRWGTFELKNLIIPLLQLITFGVGCTMSIDDFKNLRKMPWTIVIGAACQYSIMPLVGFTIAGLFNFPPEIAAGVILIGCSPSGMASNVMTLIARGNLALSVSITTVATLLSPLLTPLLMKLLGGTYIELSFWKMFFDIIKILIVPIGLGLAFHYIFRKRAAQLKQIMPAFSMAGIALIIVVITAAGRDSLLSVGFLLILAMFLHMTIGFGLGYAVSRILRLSEADSRTIALEVGMQNGGLASGIAASMGKIATLGLAAAVNGPLMNTVFSVIASWWSKKE